MDACEDSHSLSLSLTFFSDDERVVFFFFFLRDDDKTDLSQHSLLMRFFFE